MTADDARRLALSLPGAVEQDHHGRPSFRAGGRIFATLWTPTAMNVMAPADVILAAVGDAPGTCEAVTWGKRLSAVRVHLDEASPDHLEGLLHAAWSRVGGRA